MRRYAESFGISSVILLWQLGFGANTHDENTIATVAGATKTIRDIIIVHHSLIHSPTEYAHTFRMQTVNTRHWLCLTIYSNRARSLAAYQPPKPSRNDKNKQSKRDGDGEHQHLRRNSCGQKRRTTIFCIKRPTRPWMANSQSLQAQVNTLKLFNFIIKWNSLSWYVSSWFFYSFYFCNV